MSAFKQACRLGEVGQALLEYVLVISCIALPLILVASRMQEGMTRFLRHLIATVAVWPIGT